MGGIGNPKILSPVLSVESGEGEPTRLLTPGFGLQPHRPIGLVGPFRTGGRKMPRPARRPRQRCSNSTPTQALGGAWRAAHPQRAPFIRSQEAPGFGHPESPASWAGSIRLALIGRQNPPGVRPGRPARRARQRSSNSTSTQALGGAWRDEHPLRAPFIRSQEAPGFGHQNPQLLGSDKECYVNLGISIDPTDARSAPPTDAGAPFFDDCTSG